MSRLVALSTVLVAFASCGKKSNDADIEVKPAAVVPPEAAPAVSPVKPVAATSDNTEPALKPTCAKLLPKELVEKNFAGMTVATTTEGGERAACSLQNAGAAPIAVGYDCSTAIREGGPGAFMQERDTMKGATVVPKLGFAAYQIASAFRVLGDDAPCRIDVRWADKVPANAVELVRAIVSGATLAAVK